jgi:ABC-type glycerol-3-phosphate transport system substrate-binding protein
MKRLAALLAALALLAGCGGGGGTGDSGGNGGTGPSKAGGEVEDELAHTMGFQQCDGYAINDLAATYNTEQTAEAVAEAVARTTPAQPEARNSIKQGCLDGLKK